MVLEIDHLLKIDSLCENFENLPEISIIVNARKSYEDDSKIKSLIKLKPEDYLISGHQIKNNLKRRNECQLAFLPMDVPAPRGPLFVFGEYFLRKYYTVFDRDKKVFGYADSNLDMDDKWKILNISTPYDTINKSLLR